MRCIVLRASEDYETLPSMSGTRKAHASATIGNLTLDELQKVIQYGMALRLDPPSEHGFVVDGTIAEISRKHGMNLDFVDPPLSPTMERYEPRIGPVNVAHELRTLGESCRTNEDRTVGSRVHFQ